MKLKIYNLVQSLRTIGLGFLQISVINDLLEFHQQFYRTRYRSLTFLTNLIVLRLDLVLGYIAEETVTPIVLNVPSKRV